jgi:hypothetical protein
MSMSAMVPLVQAILESYLPQYNFNAQQLPAPNNKLSLMNTGIFPEDLSPPKSILKRTSEHQPKRLQKKTLSWKAIEEVRLISSCLDPELQDCHYSMDVKHPDLHLIEDMSEPYRMTKLRQINMIKRHRKLLGLKCQRQLPAMTQNSSFKRKIESDDLPEVQPKRQAIEYQTSCARTRPLVRKTTSLHTARPALVKSTPEGISHFIKLKKYTKL